MLEPALGSDDRALTRLICSETDRIRDLVDQMEAGLAARPREGGEVQPRGLRIARLARGDEVVVLHPCQHVSEAFLGAVGLSGPAGEKGRSVLEMTWSRPTCEINGITGGYTGDGFKTVIPAKASAKISFRMVAGQDPAKIREAFRAHVRARVPADCSVTFHEHGGSPAIAVPTDGKFLRQALDALTAEWGQKAAITASGGSIPVAGDFKRLLNLETLLIGFGLDDDRIHSPNEKYDLTSFHKGTRSWARILAALAQG